MKQFTTRDLIDWGKLSHWTTSISDRQRQSVKTKCGKCIILADFRNELQDSPLQWQMLGLSQTASGYGNKLTSRYKISFNGRMYRVYSTCHSNAASHWFTVKGQKIYIN